MSTAVSEGEAILADKAKRQAILAGAASIFGWGLDLFDLFILLYVAPVVGQLFFPSSNPMLSLAGAYASFAVTVLIRPVGSAIFGSFADRRGRRGAMVVAIIGVGVSTAALGLLPTVAQVGLAAPLLFLFLRLVQGVFVGGVVASTHTMGTEAAPPRWRGLMSGAIGGGGSAIGTLLASMVFFVVSLMFPGDAFNVWGWRVMFFSGLITSVLGLFIFRNLEESPYFKALAERKGLNKQQARALEPKPLRALWTGYKKIFLVNVLLTTAAGSGYYLVAGYLPSYLNLVNRLPNHSASAILVAASIAGAVGALSLGEISERIGRRGAFKLIGWTRLLLVPVLFLVMARIDNLGLLAILAVAIGFLGSAAHAPVLIFLNERFPTEVRATGTGLCWNIGFAIGGVMPTFVSLAAGASSGIPTTLAIFTFAMGAVYLAAAYIVPETRGQLK